MIKNVFHLIVYEVKALKAKIKGVFNSLYHCYGNHYTMKMTTTCLPMIVYLCNTNIVASFDRGVLNWVS